MRNLFALIQIIRDNIDGGWEDESFYYKDPVTTDDPAVPEEDGPADDDEDYDDLNDEMNESEEEEEKQKDVAVEAANAPAPADAGPEEGPVTPSRSASRTKRLLRRRSSSSRKKPRKARSIPNLRLVPKDSELSLESTTPAPPLPRSNTDESYAMAETPGNEDEKARTLHKLLEKIAKISIVQFFDCKKAM